jgi:ATP-dependent Clp protease ATP-binding subunit ClpB
MLPEILGRVPVIAPLKELDENQLCQILTKPKNALVKQYKELLAYEGVELEFTDAAIDVLGKAGYDPEFGARPVKRAIQNLVLNQLSRDIIAMKVNRNRPITIDAENGELVFRN